MKIINRLLSLIRLISTLMISMLTLIVFYDVLSRYFFNRPWAPSNELTKFIFSWLALLGVILITADNSHLTVTYFRDKLPLRVRKIINVVTQLIMLVFMVLMLKSGIDLTKLAFQQSLPVLSISKMWLYLSMPVSFLATIILLIYNFKKNIKEK
jgi:TRAP-type C4-dicarboxylate transport system permease small subunit